jgi:hypothetical protein
MRPSLHVFPGRRPSPCGSPPKRAGIVAACMKRRAPWRPTTSLRVRDRLQGRLADGFGVRSSPIVDTVVARRFILPGQPGRGKLFATRCPPLAALRGQAAMEGWGWLACNPALPGCVQDHHGRCTIQAPRHQAHVGWCPGTPNGV